MAIYGVFHSFWFAIVVMTLLVRTAMIPLVFRQLQSSKVMQELSPQIQQIQREYRQEPMVMQQKMNQLYKANNYSPYASCLPLVVQLPFLYGLFGAFNTILRDSHVTASKLNNDLYPFVRPIFGPQGLTKLPDMHFLWANLATPDAYHVLPVLAAILTFVQIRMSLKKPQVGAAAKPKTGAPDPNAASMKLMQFLMPGFTLFIGWTFPAGLALYWIVTTGYSVLQQYFFNGRNWGGLLDGIPGLSPAPALAGTAAIVDGTISPNRNRRRNVTVTEEKAATLANRARAIPAAIITDDEDDTDATDVPASGKNVAPKTPTRPVAAKTTGPISKTPSTPLRATANGKKESVRLVSTPNANGNGNKPATAVVTRAPRTTVATPRVTTKPKTTKGSSKKGR
ncbi:MAG: membrane protein insertase YidC [Ktedonobacterales bacterium]|nr:membrane protein insertase YidC [Ktedonobacterales bacterium]